MALRSVPMFPSRYSVLSFTVGTFGSHLEACSGLWLTTHGVSVYPLLLLYLLTHVDSQHPLLAHSEQFTRVEESLLWFFGNNLSRATRAALAAFVLSRGYQNRVARGFYIMFSVLTIISFITWFVSITGNGHAGLANATHPTFTSPSVDVSQASAHCHAVLEIAESRWGLSALHCRHHLHLGCPFPILTRSSVTPRSRAVQISVCVSCMCI